MNCIELDPLIYPYLDGELDEAERGHIETHAAGCAGCRARLSREAAFQGALRRSAQMRTRAPAPEALRAMLRAGIRREHRRVQMLSWARWGTVAFVAAAAGIVYLEERPGHREQIVEDAALRYQRPLPFELTQASRADVERFFGDNMRLPVPLPHVPGATIAGARLSNLREHDAAYVVYQMAPGQRAGEDRRLGLFVLQDPDREIPSVASWPQVGMHSVHGFSVASWRSGGLVYELVSDMDEADLRQTLREIDPTGRTPSPPPEVVAPVRQRPMLPIPPQNPALQLIPVGFQGPGLQN
ncbi:MAG TPA: zf-HC2 domain-containing protein [Myxococcaceae bacterium]|nr:zf-HC2 domain-containing protein [Myxococcaceae bacterium]